MSIVDANVVCFQSTSIFPSWTSRVRSPSPAFKINNIQPSENSLCHFVPHSSSIHERRFKGFYRLDTLFQRRLCINIEIYIQGVSELICNDLRIHLFFPHQRRMRPPQYLEIDPFQSSLHQFGPNLPAPHAIFPNRRGQLLRRKEPCIGSAVWR